MICLSTKSRLKDSPFHLFLCQPWLLWLSLSIWQNMLMEIKSLLATWGSACSCKAMFLLHEGVFQWPFQWLRGWALMEWTYFNKSVSSNRKQVFVFLFKLTAWRLRPVTGEVKNSQVCTLCLNSSLSYLLWHIVKSLQRGGVWWQKGFLPRRYMSAFHWANFYAIE